MRILRLATQQPINRRVPKAIVRFVAIVCLIGTPSICCSQQEYTLQHRNGLQLGPGLLLETDSLSTNTFQQGGDGPAKRIFMLDDRLRVTYINSHPRTILSQTEYTGSKLVEFELTSAAMVAKGGTPPAIRGVLAITKFDRYGRRRFAFSTSRGRVDVLQGITRLSPVYARVDVLRTKADKFVWDQRIATNSIPQDQLRAILMQVIEQNRSAEWLRVVDFYIQMNRFGEARDVLEDALERFPVELATERRLLVQIDQQYATQKFEEIRLRREAGQVELAAKLLQSFPVETLPLETKLILQGEIENLQAEIAATAGVLAAFKTCLAALGDEQQKSVQLVADELLTEANLTTVKRLAAFQFLRADPAIPNENLVAHAIGGWLLGDGAGLDNFAVTQSLVRVRELVVEYLNEPNPAARDALIARLRSEEGAQPQYISRLLATMKPPQMPAEPMASGVGQDGSEAGDVLPGFYESSAMSASGQQVQYVVQLPPEYDPNQKYPCVLTLGGHGETLQQHLNWWCGWPYKGQRYGEATRRGYIVVTPRWMTDDQATYNYTEGEHDRVLSCYRDALRQFSIDTDRVFIGGHLDGATAAWDIAGSHPDMWAGLIAISPEADKYTKRYWENLGGYDKGTPPFGVYVVYGQRDGTLANNAIGNVLTKYLSRFWHDCMVVEYRGNGRLRFSSELPRIAEWMDLAGKRRMSTPGVRNPPEVFARTMRYGDRFFYWLEAPAVLPTVVPNPFMLDETTAGTFEARTLGPTENTFLISSIPSPGKAATVWLSPDLVDFSRTIKVRIQGRTRNFPPEETRPDIRVMLEDSRQRGERQSVYWQKITIE